MTYPFHLSESPGWWAAWLQWLGAVGIPFDGCECLWLDLALGLPI